MAHLVATDPVRRATRRTGALAVAVGSAVVILVLLADFTGLLGGWPLIVLGVVAALAVPVSREASRRVLLVGCIALGWGPMMWWFPIGIPGLSRAGMAVAVLVGVLTGLLVAGRVRAAALVPRFRLSDLVTLAAALLATWMVWPLFTVRDGETALRILGLGWDYAAHVDMTEMIRRLGSVAGMGSPGPFGQWDYAGYPKAFHAAVATLMESTVGTGLGSQEAELVGFLHATAVLGIAAVTVVAAGVVAMVRLRRNPLLATLLGGLVILALTLGPGGGSLLEFGFPNFLLATALLACVPLIVVGMARVASMAPLLALSGVLVGVAHNWALLLIPAFAALIAVLFPLRRRRWPSTAREWIGPAVIVAATVLAGVAAWWTLRQGPAEDLTSQPWILIHGGFVGGSRIEILLPAILAIGACAAVGWMTHRRGLKPADGEAVRTAAEILLPLVGLVLLGFVAFVQLRGNGDLGYYFYKLGTGIQLASVVVVAVAIPVLLRAGRTARSRRTLLAATGLGLAVLIATSSGAVNPTSEALSFRRPPGLDARAAWQTEAEGSGSEPVFHARDVLDAAAVASGGTQYFWVPAELDGTTAPRLENQWLFALTGQWSVGADAVVNELWGDSVPRAERPADPGEAVERILEAAPDSIVVVPPETFERLAGQPRFVDHILTW